MNPVRTAERQQETHTLAKRPGTLVWGNVRHSKLLWPSLMLPLSPPPAPDTLPTPRSFKVSLFQACPSLPPLVVLAGGSPRTPRTRRLRPSQPVLIVLLAAQPVVTWSLWPLLLLTSTSSISASVNPAATGFCASFSETTRPGQVQPSEARPTSSHQPGCPVGPGRCPHPTGPQAPTS